MESNKTSHIYRLIIFSLLVIAIPFLIFFRIHYSLISNTVGFSFSGKELTTIQENFHVISLSFLYAANGETTSQHTGNRKYYIKSNNTLKIIPFLNTNIRYIFYHDPLYKYWIALGESSKTISNPYENSEFTKIDSIIIFTDNLQLKFKEQMTPRTTVITKDHHAIFYILNNTVKKLEITENSIKISIPTENETSQYYTSLSYYKTGIKSLIKRHTDESNKITTRDSLIFESLDITIYESNPSDSDSIDTFYTFNHTNNQTLKIKSFNSRFKLLYLPLTQYNFGYFYILTKDFQINFSPIKLYRYKATDVSKIIPQIP